MSEQSLTEEIQEYLDVMPKIEALQEKIRLAVIEFFEANPNLRDEILMPHTRYETMTISPEKVSRRIALELLKKGMWIREITIPDSLIINNPITDLFEAEYKGSQQYKGYFTLTLKLISHPTNVNKH